MSAYELYTQIREAIQCALEEDVRDITQERLALLIMGMIEAKSASPAQIATAIHRLGLSRAKVASIERRIRRIENDPDITDVQFFHPFARQRLILAQPKSLLLILDPTTQDDRVFLVTIAVWYRGRALPLVWMAWEANKPLIGDGFWVRIASLLDIVADLLPKNVTVTWLADRAFGTPAFTDLVQEHGWDYVVRTQAQTRCRDRLQQEKKVVSLLRPYRRRAKMRGEAFKGRGWRIASIVVFWSKNHKSPLCLVSSLPTGWYLIRLYRRRYPIEATFRDFKSYGWQWERGQVSDLSHVEHLLVSMAFASWFAIGTGAQFAAEYLAIPASGKRRTLPFEGKRSLFTHGLERLRDFIMGNRFLDLWWLLPMDDDLNWQERVYFHFARPFVFGR